MVLRRLSIGSSTGASAAVADDVDDLATDAEVVAVVERRLLAALEALAVEERAVAAVEVLDDELALVDVEARVVARREVVVEGEPAVAHASDEVGAGGQSEGSTPELDLELRHRRGMVPQDAGAPQAPDHRVYSPLRRDQPHDRA
jgi:hypothetical protein